LAISVYGGGWGKATSLLIGTASVTKKIDFNNKMIKKKQCSLVCDSKRN
jgi:hypothetical protein